MRRSLIVRSILGAGFGVFVTIVSASGQDPDPKLKNKGTPETVLGYVRDVGCLMRHPDVLKPTNDCAVMCAKASVSTRVTDPPLLFGTTAICVTCAIALPRETIASHATAIAMPASRRRPRRRVAS